MPAPAAVLIVTAVVVLTMPDAAAAYDHSNSGSEYGLLIGTPINVPIALCSRAVLPAMLAQGRGKIVHISAGSALKGSANHAAYAASKSAVARLTESMAEEYKRQGIHVNAILRKLDAHSRTEAVIRAGRMGLISL